MKLRERQAIGCVTCPTQTRALLALGRRGDAHGGVVCGSVGDLSAAVAPYAPLLARVLRPGEAVGSFLLARDVPRRAARGFEL